MLSSGKMLFPSIIILLLNRKLKHIMTPIWSIYGAFHGFCETKLSHPATKWNTCNVWTWYMGLWCSTWRYPHDSWLLLLLVSCLTRVYLVWGEAVETMWPWASVACCGHQLPAACLVIMLHSHTGHCTGHGLTTQIMETASRALKKAIIFTQLWSQWIMFPQYLHRSCKHFFTISQELGFTTGAGAVYLKGFLKWKKLIKISRCLRNIRPALKTLSVFISRHWQNKF